MDRIVQILKALSDETRLSILIILSSRRICAKGLAKHLDISEATVSQHLKVLREAGIILGEKEGYYVYYNIQEPILDKIVSFIEEIKGQHTLGCCKLGVQIPNDCLVTCKAEKKCCKIKTKD